MSDEEFDLIPSEIYDDAIRHIVVLLQAEFPNETLESCYFWYLYHHSDYDATKASLAQGSPEFSSDFTINSTTKKSDTDNVSLGVFPAEIWSIISSHLAYEELSSLRLTNSALADISAESMLKSVRFDLSFASLERLRFIAGHKHLRKSVKTLVFEAGLLGQIGCIHHYASHYDLEHHKETKPQPPPESDSTPQAQRLYTRNLAKFNKELDAKYAAYRISFEAQERLLNAPKKFLFRCIDKFPNIENITFVTDQCRHLLSQRFVERYGQDCAVPMSTNSSQTPWQLQHILRPGLKSLHARLISPEFFNGKSGRSRKWLESIFKNLDQLYLVFRHEGFDGHEIASMLRDTNLSYAVGTATELTRLVINSSTILPVGQLKDMLPQGKSFPKLQDLNIESFTTTETDFIEMLKMQPALKTLDIADVTLSSGSWRKLLKRIRDDLKLQFFTSGGVLSDVAVELYTDHYSIEAWQDGEMMSLGVAIDLYITSQFVRGDNTGDDEFEQCWNPVNRFEDGDYMPYDNLVDEFGPIDDSDLEDDMDESDDEDDDDDEGDSDDDDNSDIMSMHTANEDIGEDGNEIRPADGNNNDKSGRAVFDEDHDDDLPDLEDLPSSPMSVD